MHIGEHMFKNKKQGFSLIEVMILFTLLAVILAASMPILTKKSNPIPRRVPHGVYRCYANQEGNIIEELYNANGLVDTKNLGQAQCRFTVPTASVYTIELYGAGAGGTKYAEMTPTLSQDEDREFTLANAVDYDKSPEEKYINPPGSGYKLTDRVIQDAFKGQQVIISAFSQNAGKGGTAKAVFYSPSNIRCNNSSLSNIPIDKLYIDPFKNKFSYNDNDIVPVKTKDGSNNNYDHFQTQVDWYCKIASMDEYTQRQGLYNSTGWKTVSQWMSQAPDGLTCDDSGKGCFHYVGSPREVVENGGFGGLGTFSNLSYTLPESPIVTSSASEKFPYVISIGSIFGNAHDDYGFYTASCNNNGACTQKEIPTRGEDGNNDTEGAKHIDFTSAILNTYPVEGKLLKADNGASVERRLAWQRADNKKLFMFGNKLPASGGKGGTIQVTSSTAGLPNFNNVNAVINLLNRNYLWKLNANSDNLDGVNAEGVDTTGTNSYGINFSISASNKGISQTPSISIKSKMLEKHYKLGMPGSNGQKRTFKVSSLGKSCTLHVAQGGEPLDYVNLLSNKKTQDEIKSIAREKESKLNTSMRCTDGNDLTFQDSAEGGKYNLSLYEPAPFVWKDGDKLGKEYTVSANDAVVQPNNPIDSIFGHAYKKLFSKLYVSDITSLLNYNISYGGAGSTLSDSCTVPKGITKIDLVTTKITRTLNTDKNSNNYGEITEEESSSNKNIKNDENDGKRDNENCYVTNYGPIVDLIVEGNKENGLHKGVQEKLLFTDVFLKIYNPMINGKRLYTLNAGTGGGGAIVITW